MQATRNLVFTDVRNGHLGNGCVQGMGQIPDACNLHPGCVQPHESFTWIQAAGATGGVLSQPRRIWGDENLPFSPVFCTGACLCCGDDIPTCTTREDSRYEAVFFNPEGIKTLLLATTGVSQSLVPTHQLLLLTRLDCVPFQG